jgi:hypothetical protein
MFPAEPMAACAAITLSSSSSSVSQPRTYKSDISIGRDALEDDSLDLVEQLFPGNYCFGELSYQLICSYELKCAETRQSVWNWF